MTKNTTALFCGLTLVVVDAVGGDFSYNGLVRTEIAASTTGDRTLAADAGTPLDNEGRDLNLAALRVELDTKYTFDRRLSVTGRLRGWSDWVNKLDDSYNDDIDLFAGDEFPGNGSLLSTIDSENAIIDIPELYLDWTIGNLWLRAGKQQIAWGDAIGMRILDDMISSLDVRRHGGNFDLGTEEFLDERIGQTGVRANYRFPRSDWELEISITDFLPTIAFPAGSPYANIPAAVRVLGDDGISAARDDPVYAIRAKGLIFDGRGELTFAYSKRPQSVPVLTFDPADAGILLSSGELPLRVEHPRIDAVGGAISYSVSADPVGPWGFFDGLIARLEAAYFFDKKFTNPVPSTPPGFPTPIPFAGEVIQNDELSIGVVLEKTHKFHPDWLATTIVLEWWHRTQADLNETHQSLEGDSDWDWFLLSVSQNFKRNQLTVGMNTFYDTSGGWFLQPAVRWRPNTKYQLDLFYNWFHGGTDDIYGPLESNNEIVMRLGTFF